MNHFTVPCPHCESVFPVDPAKVPDEGVRARCTNCGGIFLVEKPAPEPEVVETESTGDPTGAEPAAWGAAAAGAAAAGAAAVLDGPDVVEDDVEEADVHDAVEAAVEEAVAEETVEPVAQEPAEAAIDEEPAEAALDEEPAEAALDEESAEAAIDEEPAQDVGTEVGTVLDDPAEEAADTAPFGMDDDDAAFGAFDDGFGDITLDEGLDVDEPVDLVAEPEEAPTADSEATESVEVEDVDPSDEGGDDWVIETEEPLDTAAPIEVAPLDTVEAQVRGFQEETFEAPPEEGIGRVLPGQEDAEFSGYAGLPAIEEPAGEEPEAEEPEAAEETEPEAESAAGESETALDEPKVTTPEPEEPAAEAPAEPAAAPKAFKFGRRDPHEKAKRLARVLVSDMITYNPERHSRALEAGTIPQDFEDEISKSWTEYVDQVGVEIAESTEYWTDALNEVLAKGEKLF